MSQHNNNDVAARIHFVRLLMDRLDYLAEIGCEEFIHRAGVRYAGNVAARADTHQLECAADVDAIAGGRDDAEKALFGCVVQLGSACPVLCKSREKPLRPRPPMLVKSPPA